MVKQHLPLRGIWVNTLFKDASKRGTYLVLKPREKCNPLIFTLCSGPGVVVSDLLCVCLFGVSWVILCSVLDIVFVAVAR